MTITSRRPLPPALDATSPRPDPGPTPDAAVEAVLLASTRAVPGVAHISVVPWSAAVRRARSPPRASCPPLRRDAAHRP